MDNEYPFQRAPIIGLSSFSSLQTAWESSREVIDEIRSILKRGEVHPTVETVVVSGSLGRMELLPHSDLDAIVVLNDSVDLHTDVAMTAYESVISQLQPLGLALPEQEGIFTTPTSRGRLCDPADLGVIDEDLRVFGKRIQLLLDCQPVFGDKAFETLIDAVLRRYGSGDVIHDPSQEWSYLIHDLSRYFRSLAVNTFWRRRDSPQAWRLRNLKLAHSRRLLYAGLMLMLGECSIERRDKFRWLRPRLTLTPMERIGIVYESYGDDRFDKILSCYDVFLSCMQDLRFRHGLASADHDHGLEECDGYLELDKNAKEMLSELGRFVLERTSSWSSRLFEQLLFF